MLWSSASASKLERHMVVPGQIALSSLGTASARAPPARRSRDFGTVPARTTDSEAMEEGSQVTAISEAEGSAVGGADRHESFVEGVTLHETESPIALRVENDVVAMISY